jgi:hypothetical protein
MYPCLDSPDSHYAYEHLGDIRTEYSKWRRSGALEYRVTNKMKILFCSRNSAVIFCHWLNYTFVLCHLTPAAAIAQSVYRWTTAWGDKVSTFESRQRPRVFSLLHSFGPTQPPVQWVWGGVVSPKSKAAGGCSWPLTHLHLVQDWEQMGVYHHHTPPP